MTKLSRRNARKSRGRKSRGRKSVTRRRKQRGGEANAHFPKVTKHLYNEHGNPLSKNNKMTIGVHKQIENELKELEGKGLVHWHLEHNHFVEP